LKNKNKNKCEQGTYILSTTLAPSFSNQTARRRRHRRRRRRRGACSCCMGKTQAWRKGEQAAAVKRTSKPLALPGSDCQCLPNLPLPVSEIPNARDLSSFCEESYYSVGNR